ncbi:unnamed protein product [Gongylonema pulchrum]|uniref:Secreted protein n=1 Tax=Gongylonema pulchrum TaxID=637853 RepID=A0A183EUD3_9BILA|nr:unnamed protein product [Gongylonema pulchrum]
MQVMMIVFSIIPVLFAQLYEQQANLFGSGGLQERLGSLAPFLGSAPGNSDKTALNLLKLLGNGLAPATNPGHSLLTHGTNFGLAALRTLGNLLQANQEAAYK